MEKVLLKSILNYGTKWHDFNFTSIYNRMEKFNNPNKPPKEMDFYTFEEFEKFISVEDDLRYRTLFETLYYLGLRRGELRGLTWKSIDFNHKILHVYQNVVNVPGDIGFWQITTPKTKNSKRDLIIPDVLLNDLKKLKKYNQDIIDFDKGWFVFGNINPIHPYSINLRNKRNADLAGLKRIRLHDFRHSAASLLISKGANIVLVAKFLGHTKIDETLNTYSHLFPSDLTEIVNIINDLE